MTVSQLMWVCSIVIASVALLYNNSELDRWFWKKFINPKIIELNKHLKKLEQDRKEFEKRSSTVRDYFGSIEVMDGKFLDGELSLGENVADLGGVSCMLELAKDYKDFDYKEFFETYARIWKKQMPKEVIDVILKDPHAPGYVRTNACVQQFEEFYKAFDVHEGDGMYLPPQNRVAVW